MPTSSIPAMRPAIRLGLRSAWRIRGYRVSTITPATAKDTPTSRGVWTPRYSREKDTSSSTATQAHRTQGRQVDRAMPPKVATAFWVWPLGKE